MISPTASLHWKNLVGKPRAKLDNIVEEDSSLSNSSTSSSTTSADTVLTLVNEETLSHLVSALPCESPVVSGSGVAVFGTESFSSGRSRSVSTSVNRVQFPEDLSSTFLCLTTAEGVIMDEASYKGYKLNCFKKKRKVESLIELYDKDCVNSLQDRDIFKQKLEAIASAALETVEYCNELIAELELNSEQGRIDEVNTIKEDVKNAVRKNEKEVKEEMQRIINESGIEASATNQSVQVDSVVNPLSIMSSTGDSTAVNPNTEAKLLLKHGYIKEDVTEINTVISRIKLAKDLTDAEVIYYMREGRSWDKRVSDLIAENRKFQLEAYGFASLHESASSLDTEVKAVKTVKDNKLAAIAREDESRGLSSLCENKNKSSIVFPEPFKGHYGENVFKFKEEICAAIKDSQIKKADEVRVFLKYLKGDARSKVGDHQPTLEAALETLVAFYGNANLIWMK